MKDDAKKIFLVAGARPNFMKIAPVARALEKEPERFSYKIVHTGQHYDRGMSDVFFEELGILAPDYHLEAGSGSHARQTAKVMTAFESLCKEDPPDLVVVVGDVNSTLACSITAKKLLIPVAHVEAGLRSRDMTMPEEINRIVTDAISDYLFVTEKSGEDNLMAEGRSKDQIFFVGHVMIDNLMYQLDRLKTLPKADLPSNALKDRFARYGVVTLHRPSNVDDKKVLKGIAEALATLSKDLPLIFPVHPRTRKNLDRFGIVLDSGIVTTEPLSYMDFLNLWKDAALVLTDSGGLQEETTALGISCLTLRDNTERPVTVSEGTNRVIGSDPEAILAEAGNILRGKAKKGGRPALWDGRAAERIVEVLKKAL
ncbi:MAG: UDP-N-acetylglucosamine 2-epimerase (non-hydrolyzing) [Deltaproteobacteria bacterium]|nr:UDP-N-acetylglucosamine 2-epimerase (non-hydrolyzing) [Deltaproteobacteria bacterium]